MVAFPHRRPNVRPFAGPSAQALAGTADGHSARGHPTAVLRIGQIRSSELDDRQRGPANPSPNRRSSPGIDRLGDHSMAIGEIDQTVFDCPNCSRPLAVGARRCPGCRTRLVIGVPLSKASVFASGGLAIGLAFGGVGGAVFGLTQPKPVVEVPPIVGASAVPGGGSDPVSSAHPLPSALPGTGGGTTSSMPSISSSALVQAATVNDRLKTASGFLSTALSTSPFDASSVAQTLRSISADTVYARQLADKVAGWSGSAAVGTDLASLYDSIHDTAIEALTVSVTNPSAYRTSAKAMVRALAGLRTVDARIAEVAAANGVVLPQASPAP